jgi:hypothetical protein
MQTVSYYTFNMNMYLRRNLQEPNLICKDKDKCFMMHCQLASLKASMKRP